MRLHPAHSPAAAASVGASGSASYAGYRLSLRTSGEPLSNARGAGVPNAEVRRWLLAAFGSMRLAKSVARARFGAGCDWLLPADWRIWLLVPANG